MDSSNTAWPADKKTPPTFREALAFWIKLGFIGFGGPAGQIAIMHEHLVGKKKWISESKFLHALNYCMILPGPEAQQLATYMGWLLHGTRGGLAAGILFVLPSMFILLGLSAIYVSYGAIPWVSAMFDALKPAIVAIVVLALLKIARKALVSPLHVGMALAAFVCLFVFNVSFPLVMLGVILSAAGFSYLLPARLAASGLKTGNLSEERDYFINRHSVVPASGFNLARLIRQTGTSFLLWALPLLMIWLISADFAFWKTLILFFTQAAFVTFGGAYAVLPYVAQVSVEEFHWLTSLQMIDGLALGETTPGPLIMVLAFVGFMAGYNHFGHSMAMGAAGLIATTAYTFLPCFLFIFAGAPVIERTQDNKYIKTVLSLVTAAVVGVILNLAVYLGRAVYFPGALAFSTIDFVALGWTVISLVALSRFKVNMIAWIAASALFGLGYHLATAG